MQSLEQALPAL
jgi:hypothetical protein